jgi:hypothetical protein
MLTTLTHYRHHQCHLLVHSLLQLLALLRALSSHTNSSSSSMLQLQGVLLVGVVLVVLGSINNTSSSSKEVNLRVQREGVEGMAMRHVEEGTNLLTRSVFSHCISIALHVYIVLSRAGAIAVGFSGTTRKVVGAK